MLFGFFEKLSEAEKDDEIGNRVMRRSKVFMESLAVQNCVILKL